MQFSPLIEQFMEALRCLPGVGPRSAQRMALHLLERDREGGRRLAQVLQEALDQVGHCRRCRTLTEEPECRICRSSKRNEHMLCVVETPADMLALEQTGIYDGHYFVLLGHLSPIEGIGPEDLGLDDLLSRVQDGMIEEVILATNPTAEGETTAHYIHELLRPLDVRVTRLAHGVPLGGELEYVDGGTLSRALVGRGQFD